MLLSRVTVVLGIAGVLSLLSVRATAQESAVPGARATVKQAPADAPAALALGRALRIAGRDVEAAQELRRGAALPAGRSGPLGIALRWEAARTAISRRDFRGAIQLCRDVGAIKGGEQVQHACAAQAHLLWRRASEALSETQQALVRGPQYEALIAEGMSHELELHEDLAEGSYRLALNENGSRYEAHAALGDLLVRQHRADEGMAELRRAVALAPGDPDAAFALGSRLGETEEAATQLELAARERPTFAAAWRRLAEVRLARGQKGDAHAAADQALKLEPNESAHHVVLGRVHFEEGKLDDAMREAQAAAKLLANSAPAQLLMADVFAKRGEIDFALEKYQAAYGFDHGDPSPLVRAGQACLAQGRDTSAKAFGDKASREFPDWAPGWVLLGDAAAARGEAAIAKDAYRKALQSKGLSDASAVQRKLGALK